jgi:MFS family permease
MTPFRWPAFRWLWSSSLASSGAQGMERTTTAWLALQTGGGAVAVGLVFASRMLPSLLFGLAAGTLADRSDRRRLLLLVSGTALLLLTLLSRLLGPGPAGVGQVMAIAFAIGCLQAFETPARQALVLDTVPRAEGPRALTLHAGAARLSAAAGALGAGALLPLVGVSGCYAVVAGSYAVAAALLAAVRTRQAMHGAGAPPPFWRALRDAARLIVDVPAVRSLSMAGIACEVFGFSFNGAVPVFAQDVLGAGAQGLGTLNAASALGATVAVVLLAAVPARVPREPLLGAAFITFGLSLMALAATRDVPAAAAALLVTGACAGLFDVLQQTLLQLAVPAAQRGRAVGVWVLGLGSAPVGYVEVGLLVATLGAPGALLVNGTLVAAAAVLLTRAPAYRWAFRRGG